MPNYLVVATSGRAIAQGLTSLGHSSYVIDGFADSDTCKTAIDCTPVRRTQFGLDHDEVLHAIESLQDKTSFDGLFYDAALESMPDVLDKVGITSVFGNSKNVLEACKNPRVFFSCLEQNKIPYPESIYEPQVKSLKKNDWLIKHVYSTGGMGVRKANGGRAHTDGSYYQKQVDGQHFSITFLANGKDMVALGFNTLWSEKLNDEIPYAYAGAINSVKLDEAHKNNALHYAKLITKELQLVGLNSVDCILQEDVVYVLEVNPRIPATYEIYETKQGELMHEHMQACVELKLPTEQRPHLLRAHAIVYAPHQITVPAEMSWPLWTADRPSDQEVIKMHEPICSIFAGGQNSAQVCEMIKTRKQTILAKLVNETGCE